MSVVKGNGMGKGRRRKEVVVGVLNGEKEWQSKSVVENGLCINNGHSTIDGWNVFWCITNQSTMCSLKRGV